MQVQLFSPATAYAGYGTGGYSTSGGVMWHVLGVQAKQWTYGAMSQSDFTNGDSFRVVSLYCRQDEDLSNGVETGITWSHGHTAPRYFHVYVSAGSYYGPYFHGGPPYSAWIPFKLERPMYSGTWSIYDNGTLVASFNPSWPQGTAVKAAAFAEQGPRYNVSEVNDMRGSWTYIQHKRANDGAWDDWDGATRTSRYLGYQFYYEKVNASNHWVYVDTKEY